MTKSKKKKIDTSLPTKRDIVLILGMHRSGTSGVSGVLSKLTGGAPKTLYGSFPSNLMGHWESEPIFRFNDRILGARGTHWNDWTLVPDMQDKPVFTEREMEEAVELLSSEYGNVRFPVVKDPRMCRLAPFWLEAFRRWGGELHVIMPLRSPLEVANSLKARQDKWALIQTGLFLWVGHVLEAELATRGRPRILFLWDTFINDWRSVLGRITSAIGAEFPHPSQALSDEIDAFLRRDLRHHTMSLEEMRADPDMTALIVDTYQAISLLSERDEPAVHVRLDGLRARFLEVSAPLVRLRSAYESAAEQAQKIPHLKADLTYAQAMIESQANSLDVYKKSNDDYSKLVSQYKVQAEKAPHLQADLEYARGMLEKQTQSLDAYKKANEDYSKLVLEYKIQAEKVPHFQADLEYARGILEHQTHSLDVYKRSNDDYSKLILEYKAQAEKAPHLQADLDYARGMLEKQTQSLDAYKKANEDYSKLVLEYKVQAEKAPHLQADLEYARGMLENQAQSLDAYKKANEEYSKLISEYKVQTERVPHLQADLEYARGMLKKQTKSLNAHKKANEDYSKLVSEYQVQAERVPHLQADLDYARGMLEKQTQSLDAHKKANEDYSKLVLEYREQIMSLYNKIAELQNYNRSQS